MEIALKNRTILQGDVLEKLREIPNEFIDCVITSPPYWGLRDYQAEGQWGLETSFHEYLAKMQQFMRELKRVVKNTGTVWINLGDTYSGGNAHADWTGNTLHGELNSPKLEASAFKSDLVKNEIQAKSRFGIPERFYAQCIDAGWLARNHIPWIKENAMPSSVKDRFTNKWESIFFFAKEPQYYFNLDAVREKTITQTKPFNRRIQEAKKGFGQMKMGDLPGAFTQTALEDMTFNTKGERIEGVQTKFTEISNAQRLGKYRDNERKMANVEGQSTQGIHRNRIEGKPDWENKQDSTLGADGKPKQNYAGFNERWQKDRKDHDSQQYKDYPDRIKKLRDQGLDHEVGLGNIEEGKNPGDIFKINPRPFPEAHFATFPIDLPLKILKCACPPAGFVLDPFFGAGTVGMAAEKLGLNWVGIELKQEYIEIARKRLEPYENKKIFEVD